MDLIKINVFCYMTPCGLLAGCVTDVMSEYSKIYVVPLHMNMILTSLTVRNSSMKRISVYFTHISVPYASTSRLKEKVFDEATQK